MSVRVAIVGGGFGAHVHLPAFRRDPRASVELICASTDERARALALREGVPRASGDWRRVVADPEIDAVALAVPPALQPEIALAAAAAGKHLFLEKPVALDSAAVRALAAAVEKARVIAAVDFELRELSAWQEARSLVRSGALGRLRHVFVDWRLETFIYRDPRPSWKREAGQGGGTLNLFGSHAFDAALWLLGPARRVAARLLPDSSREADARVDAWLELADGTPVSLSLAADATALRRHRIELVGESGTLVLENSTRDYARGFGLSLGRGGEWSSVAVAELDGDGDGRIAAVGALTRRFVGAILDGGAVQPGLADGLAAQRLIDAARASHREGTWQSLDSTS